PADNEAVSGCQGCQKPLSFRRRLLRETYRATMMVIKFMALAFFLEALITLYVPAAWIIAALGPQNPWAILTATAVGIPAYTSNLTALPMLAPLLAKGMDPGAALAFLIAGSTTTLPAMAAVWGLVSRRVFVLYLSFVLVGAILFGYLFSVIHRLL
ncbi:MAG: permease, partial [candidate division Zixibacteria bacterium]|nr:permease [candidate division Zixibacteria bacterium]